MKNAHRLDKTRTAGAFALVAVLAFSAGASGRDKSSEGETPTGESSSGRSHPWDAEALDFLRKIPAQEEGRVKPLHTVANFALLRTNGKRSCEDLSEEKLTPMEWFLDCLFYPSDAERYECFLVQTTEVLDAIGVEHGGKKKRDRYTYQDIAPGRQKLFSLASSYNHIEPKDRSSVQKQLLGLAHNINYFEGLTSFLDFARHPHAVPAGGRVAEALPGHPEAWFSDIIASGKSLGDAYVALSGSHGASSETSGEALKEISAFLEDAHGCVQGSSALALFPSTLSEEALQPLNRTTTEWWTPLDLFDLSLRYSLPDHAPVVKNLEALVAERSNPAGFRAAAEKLHSGIQGLAEPRGEYDKIELEVFYYKGDFFYRSLYFFLFGFALVAVSWLRPGNRILSKAIPVVLVLGTILLCVGIGVRCVLRERPPVTTLYETILFITAIMVIVSLFIERVNRKGIGIAAAAILGSAGLFMANRYEMKDAVDTMPVLIAVLDTNFWLATHVTTVTMGYAAGLLAAAIAHIYLLGKLFGLKKGDSGFYRTLSRMTYGVVCFGLLFSLVGTVLGGIWANDSWGRFWGWDPKENGALMIVLWNLIILHSRMGGYIRDHGLATLAIFGGIIVAFSWWHVNQLGVGLHSYGETSGVLRALNIFYGSQIGVMAFGGVGFMLAKHPAKKDLPPPAVEAGPSTP